MTEADIEELRGAGFSDIEILDANNRTAHLNYTNRVANGLGLVAEARRPSDPGPGSRLSPRAGRSAGHAPGGALAASRSISAGRPARGC